MKDRAFTVFSYKIHWMHANVERPNLTPLGSLSVSPSTVLGISSPALPSYIVVLLYAEFICGNKTGSSAKLRNWQRVNLAMQK